MALSLDPSSGLPLDPATMQALQEQQLSRSIAQTGGNSRERMNDMTVGLGVQTMFPSPDMIQSRAADAALRASKLTPNAGESDLDFSIRQIAAQRDALASVSPQSSAALNTQLLKLGQMKIEQQHLVAQDQREQQTFDASAGKRTEEQATGALAYAITPDKTSPIGYRAQAFDTSNPDQLKALQQAARQQGVQIMSADKAASLFSSSNTAEMRAAAELAKAQMAVNNGRLDPNAVPNLAVQSIFDKTWLSRLTPQAKSQIQNFYQQQGITPTDIAGAQGEYKAMMTAAGQVGRREGNVKIIQTALGQMGDQVNQSLEGLTRTDFSPLNSMIMSGKKSFSDPGEARYAAAVQTFVNEYARLIAGGTGSSTEGARKEAWDTLNKAMGPAGVKAAVQQMAVRETNIVMGAGDQALEFFANPKKYAALSKIQERAGLPPPFMSNTDASVAAPQPAASSPPSSSSIPSFASEAAIPPGFKGRAIVNGVPGTVQ